MTEFTAFELNRLIQLLPTVDPTTDEYSRLLYNVEKLACAVEMIDTVLEEIRQAEDRGAVVINAAPKVVEINFTPEEKTDPPPAAEPEEPPAPAYDLVTVRAALVAAKKQGVDIKALIKSFGAANLSDLPPEKYGELMEKLDGYGS